MTKEQEKKIDSMYPKGTVVMDNYSDKGSVPDKKEIMLNSDGDLYFMNNNDTMVILYSEHFDRWSDVIEKAPAKPDVFF